LRQLRKCDKNTEEEWFMKLQTGLVSRRQIVKLLLANIFLSQRNSLRKIDGEPSLTDDLYDEVDMQRKIKRKET
jgi:hypothetical protein